MIVLKKILVATDFSEPSKAALRYGVELARKFGSSLHVLHVVDDLAAHPTAVPGGLAMDLGALQTEIESAARDNLAALLPEPDRTAVRGRFHVIVSTMPGTAILDYARDVDADLIVVGTQGRHGLARLLMGSVAQQVTRLAGCPVLTVHAPERDFIVADPPRQTQSSRRAHV